MDFAAMKRRELQALCKRHGLAAGGTNVDLVARLTATLSGSGGAAAEAVGVVVGKGCLKRSTGGDSDAAKKVTFEVEEDEEEEEVGVSGRGRRRSQVMGSPAVPKTRGRRNAGEAPAPPAAKGNGGGRRRTRSQAGGDSADESDSGETVSDAPVRPSVPRKSSAKAEQQEVDVGDEAGRRHQLKRKTRENDTEDVDASGQLGVSRRSTRSSGLLSEPDALSSPVEKKRGRRKAADVNEKTSVEEQPTEALPSGRALRSGAVVVALVPPAVPKSKKSRRELQEEEPAVERVAVNEKTSVEKQPTEALPSSRALRSGAVVVAPVPPAVPKSKKSRRELQEEEPAVEKVAEVEVSRRTTRSSAVAAPVTSPSVIAKKRGRKTDDVHLDGGPDKKIENKRQSSRLTTSSSIHHVASTQEEASREQVAAPSKGLPPRRLRQDPSEANMMLNSNTTSESSRAPTSGMDEDVAKKQTVTKPVGRSTRKSVAPVILEKESKGLTKEATPEDVEKKQTVTKPVGRSTRRSVVPVILEKEIKGLTKEATTEDVEKKQTVTKPVGRSTRRSVAPVLLEKESKGLTKEAIPEAVEKKQTVKKPAGKSTRRSVAPVILEKERKALTKEMVPEAHVKRPTRKSVVPAMLEKGRKSIITEILPEAPVKRSMRKPALPIVNNENNDHCEVVSTENLQTDKSEELEKQPTVKQPVRRLTRKSAVPAMLEKDRKCVPDMVNDENGDRTEMQSDQVGHLDKQLVVKERVRSSTGKSVVPDVIEKENKGSHEELMSEVSVSTPVCISVGPNAVKENKDNNEFVGREELSVKTRSVHTSLQVALQNDETPRRATRQSSKLVLSPPPQQKPTASKGRPAKRRRTASFQETMPAEEQKEDRTNDVIEVATSTDLEIGVLPLTVEKSDLRDSQLNSELEGMVVVEPGVSRNKNDSDILESELDGTVGTTEKPPSNLPIPVCQQVGALSEEAVHSIETDAGRCSPNFEQSPTGLQFLFSQGITERSCTHNAIPCPQNSVEQSVFHKVECQGETVVSSKSVSSQVSDENSVSVQESKGCAFLSQQNIEQGFSVSSCPKDLIPSAQLDPSEDADHVLRDVTTKDLICKEEEKNNFIPSSDINVPHEISPANEPENASGVSRAVFCSSRSTPISDEVNSDSSRLVSPDALDICKAFSNTEVYQQDNKEECNLHNGVTHGIHASGMFEAAKLEVSKSGKVLLPDVETSAFRDGQLNLEREGNEFEEHSFSCGNNRSGKNNVSQLANEYVTESCQEQELKLPHDLSAVKSPKDSTTCQDEFEIGSGTGRTSGGIVEGNNIAMDAPGTAMQGDNLSPSATDLLRNREDTPAFGIDAPELSSDHLSALDLSVHAVQSVSGRLREAGLAVGNLDNKLHMEQVQQDDVQVLQGTLEMAALGSATPLSNQQRGLSEEAEPHSLKNERFSSTVEQSPFGLKSLFPSDDVIVEEGTLENAVLGSATPGSNQQRGLSEEAEPHSSTVEQSPFGLQSLFPSDDVLVEKGTLDNAAALGSATPLCNQQCGLSEEAEPHSSKNERLLSTVEQSGFGLQSLFPSDDVLVEEGTLENAVLGLTTPESNQQRGLSEEAEPLSLKNERFSSTVEQSPFGLQSLSPSDDELVEEGTLENAVLGSVTPEGQHECRSPDEAEPHPLKEICSSSAEQSPFGLQSLFLQDDAQVQEGTLEKAALGSVTPEGKHECELRDEGEPESVKNERCSSVEQSPFGLQPLFSQESIEEPSENVALAHAKNGVDESKDVHDSPTAVKHASVLGDGLLSRSLIASTDDTDVHPSSSPNQSESTDFLDEPKGCSSSEALQQALEEQCDEPKENQVTYGACRSDMIEADTAKDLESEVPPLPAEETSNVLEYSSLRESSEGFDMPGDLVLPSAENDSNTYHVELQDEKPHSSRLEHEKDEQLIAHEKDEQLIAPLLAAETSTSPDKQANPELEVGEFEKCSFSNKDTSQLEHEKDEQLRVPLLAADTSALPDEQANPELEAGQFEKCNLSSENTSGKIGAGYVNSNLFELPEVSLMDPIQGKELFNDLPAPKSPEQSTVGQDAETSALPDEQPNPDLERGEFKECNLGSEDAKNNLFQLHEDSLMGQGKELADDQPAPKSPEQSTIGLDSKTSPLPDEQPNPKLETGEFEGCNLTSEDRSGIFGTGYVKTNQVQLHDEHPIQGKELPDDLPAPKSPEQSTISQDAETSAWLDEQSNPELEAGAFEELKFSCKDTSDIFGTGYDEDNLFQSCEYPPMDSIQGKEVPNFLPAPKSPEQSTIGQGENALGSEKSPLPDEKLDPELEGEEHNDSSDKASSFIFSSGSLKDNTCHWDDKEDYNEHSDDQATAAMLSSGMTKPTLFEGSESGMALLSAAGTPALTDEQLNSKLEDDKEDNLFEDNPFFGTDTSNYSDTGLMETSDLFSLPEDAHTETCYEHELPIGTPAAKSAGAPAVTPDGSVPGSVGTCQTSCRRRVDEISKELLRFKISSAVKGSYIAMDLADTKQGDNQSSLSSLGNSENVPAVNAELSTDCSVVIDSSRQEPTDGL